MMTGTVEVVFQAKPLENFGMWFLEFLSDNPHAIPTNEADEEIDLLTVSTGAMSPYYRLGAICSTKV